MKLLRRPIIPCPHESRRALEHDTVSNLIRDELGDTATLTHDPLGRPQLTLGGRRVPVSVSHCSDEAVVAVAEEGETAIGVDVEKAREQLRRVARKFLTDKELESCTTLHDLLRAWTAKEAAYKAALKPGLPLHEIAIEGDTVTAAGKRFSLSYPLDTPEKVIAVVTARD